MKKQLACLFLFTFLVYGQLSAQAEDKLGSWYIYNGFYYLSPKIELFADTQLRLYEPVSNTERFLIRPYLSYYFNKQSNIGLGIEYHKSYSYAESGQEKPDSDEIRLTLQGMLFNFFDRTTLQHRYRLEQRWVDGISKQRARYRLQATIPLNNKSLTPGTWFVNVNNEIMITIGQDLGFNQNWTYFAPGYQFTKSLNL